MAEDRARNTRRTAADLAEVPDTMIGELIDGEVVTQPRPAAPHALVASGLGSLLGTPFHFGRGGPGGWVLLYEPELELGDDVLVPDYAGWRTERLPTVPRAARISIGPDWVCEILSPRTASRDRGRKLEIYARERVGHVWLVDPDECTVEILRLEQAGSWLRVATHTRGCIRAEPFEAIELEVDLLWSKLSR